MAEEKKSSKLKYPYNIVKVGKYYFGIVDKKHKYIKTTTKDGKDKPLFFNSREKAMKFINEINIANKFMKKPNDKKFDNRCFDLEINGKVGKYFCSKWEKLTLNEAIKNGLNAINIDREDEKNPDQVRIFTENGTIKDVVFEDGEDSRFAFSLIEDSKIKEAGNQTIGDLWQSGRDFQKSQTYINRYCIDIDFPNDDTIELGQALEGAKDTFSNVKEAERYVKDHEKEIVESIDKYMKENEIENGDVPYYLQINLNAGLPEYFGERPDRLVEKAWEYDKEVGLIMSYDKEDHKDIYMEDTLPNDLIIEDNTFNDKLNLEKAKKKDEGR